MSRYEYFLNHMGYGSHQALRDLAEEGSTVLDVGCAGGYFMEMLQGAKSCVVTGVEPEPDVADVARRRGFDVRTGIFDASMACSLAAVGPFQHIVFADVLEHLPHPEEAVGLARGLLAPGGSLLVSIPNVAYVKSRLRLLAGRFEYEDAGIFDRTHLRWFTWASVQDLFQEQRCSVVERRHVGPLSHRFGVVGERLASYAPGLLTTQMIVRATPT